MENKERLNLSVDDGIGALLNKLAKGERKRGDYLSNLLRRNQHQPSRGIETQV